MTRVTGDLLSLQTECHHPDKVTKTSAGPWGFGTGKGIERGFQVTVLGGRLTVTSWFWPNSG